MSLLDSKAGTKMAQMHLLRTFLNERLYAVADEIFGAVRITIMEYERELSHSKEEIERLSKIVELLKPKITVQDIGVTQPLNHTVVETLVDTEQQMQCPAWVQELPKPPYQDSEPLLLLKEEQKERWPCEEQEELEGQQEQSGFWSCEEHLQGLNDEQNGSWASKGEEHLPGLKDEEVETSLITSNDHGISEQDEIQSTDCTVGIGEEAVENVQPTTSKQQPEVRLGEEDQWISGSTRKSSSASCCKVCGKLVDSIHALLDHVALHAGEDRHPCGVCGHQFLSPEKLLRHINYHRTRNVCPVCGKCVCRLRRHMMIHTGEKPYRCRFCGLGFVQFTNMRSHMQTHTGEKPFKCKVCGKAFHRKANVNVHMRVHTREKPFRCDICSREFAHPHSLQTHMWIHSNDKPYHCHVCGKGFTVKCSLKVHIRSHKSQVAAGSSGNTTVAPFPFQSQISNTLIVPDVNV